MTSTPDQFTPEQVQSSEVIGPENLALSGIAASIPHIESAAEVDVQQVDPWAAYGSLGDESGTSIPGFGSETPQPTPIETPAVKERVIDENPVVNELEKTIEKAELSVQIDTEAIRRILQDNPGLIPDTSFGGMSEAFGNASSERATEVQSVLDTLANLPESLQFEQGINLFVGENGSGKSTLLHALQLRIRIQQNYEAGFAKPGETLEDYAARELDPDVIDKSGASQESRPSILAIEVAKHVKIDSFASNGFHKYYDATVLSGQRDGGSLNKRAIDKTLTFGSSHGQTTKTILDSVGESKKRLQRDQELGRKTDAGPEILFLDEIESGLSPRNQKKLQDDIESVMIEGSMALFSSNSIVLYESELPRIDMDHPELGLHVPKDHPEIYG